jgi:hypothetical protein
MSQLKEGMRRNTAHFATAADRFKHKHFVINMQQFELYFAVDAYNLLYKELSISSIHLQTSPLKLQGKM